MSDIDCDSCDERHSHKDDGLAELTDSQRLIVAALKSLDKERSEHLKEFRRELFNLEKAYLEIYKPIYLKRAELIKGLQKPKEELSEEHLASDMMGLKVSDETVPGLPGFWLRALQNHPVICSLIEDKDLEALSFLEDIRVSYLDCNPGFRLEFVFKENPFFNGNIISKEYYLQYGDTNDVDGYIYDHAVGTDIDWKEGKNLCFKIVTKTQRQKNGKGTRIVKREEPCESFFQFFYPPNPEDIENDSEEDIGELEEELEADYEAGDIFKSEIVPFAVDWFTGKALESAEYSDDYDDEDDESSGEDDDSSADDDASVTAERTDLKSSKHQNSVDDQNCKQQ